MRLLITRNSSFILYHFCEKMAVYRTYFHRTRTKSVLKIRILLITESSVLRKGSFPIIDIILSFFFFLKSYFHLKLIIRLYSKSHGLFSFFYEFFALFLYSTFCIYSSPFSIFLYIIFFFFTCIKVIWHNNNSRIFLFYRYKFYVT